MSIPLAIAQVDQIFAVTQVITGFSDFADGAEAAIGMGAVPVVHFCAVSCRQRAANLVIVPGLECIVIGFMLLDPVIYRDRDPINQGAAAAGLEDMSEITHQPVRDIDRRTGKAAQERRQLQSR